MVTSPREDCRSRGVAQGRQSSQGEVIPGGNPTGMSYLFYYTEQNTKHIRGKITNTRDLG